MAPALPDLPVRSALLELEAALASKGAAVLVAPPGSGKSTLVPLALLDAPWLAGKKIWMLEPRRLAARLLARRMAELLGEPLAATVGYAVRFERMVGPKTRIEVLTDGLFLRRIQNDPALDGVGLVILDEAHERALETDLALALLAEVRSALRPDLRLLVTSATLASEAVAQLVGQAPVLRVEGRSHPVTTEYRPPPPEVPLERHLAGVVREALARSAGDVLVFLPGAREIRAATRALADLAAQVAILPLHGDLPRAEQDRALRPDPGGRRRVILATDIAETSLTVEGVTTVVDSGLARRPRFDPRTGTSRLVTTRIARASAEQRRGRAGRTAPGSCFRLWAQAEERAMPPFERPQILDADLAPLLLELARWGVADPARLAWLDPPPEAAVAAARALLVALGALDEGGRLSAQGRAMAELPVHPRLARMLLEGRARGLGPTAVALAALLSGRDPFRTERDPDLAAKLTHLARGEAGEPAARAEFARIRKELARILAVPLEPVLSEHTGALLALAYPDRLARARAGAYGRFLLRNGRGAWLEPTSALARASFLAVAELDDAGADARILAAAALDEAALRQAAEPAVRTERTVFWDERTGSVVAEEVERIDALVLTRRPVEPDPEQARAVLLEAIRRRGLKALPWTPRARALRDRIRWLARQEPTRALPELDDAALEERLADWLGPWLEGVRRWEDLLTVDLEAALRAWLDPVVLAELDRLAPPFFTLPSGRRVAIDYGRDPPLVRVRAQELFGLDAHPVVGAGRTPLLLEILSPAERPIAVTRDLPGFWRGGWAEVRKAMRGRYPKHPWPEAPWQPSSGRPPTAGRERG